MNNNTPTAVPTIMYIHGFRSSANCNTARHLREKWGDKARIITPEVNCNPKQSLDKINSLITAENPKIIIGSSMGGLYAARAYSRNALVILINPLLIADRYLKKHVNVTYDYLSPRTDGEKQITLTQKNYEDLCELSDPYSFWYHHSGERIFAIVSTNDEVLEDSHIKVLSCLSFPQRLIKLGDFGHRLGGSGVVELDRIIGEILSNTDTPYESINTDTVSSQIVQSLGKVEHIDCSKFNVFPFHKVSDVIDKRELRFSNMAGGYPFEFAGRTWRSSEQLYLCGEFTDPKIQEEIFSAKSGYAAKRFIKAKYKQQVRKDFKEFRLQWMLFVVWLKVTRNYAFRNSLLDFLPEEQIVLVEDTTTDNGGTAEIWGARNPELRAMLKEGYDLNFSRRFGTFVGQNNIGKILMLCRACLLEGIEPPIDYPLLRSKTITLFEQPIYFTEE